MPSDAASQEAIAKKVDRLLELYALPNAPEKPKGPADVFESAPKQKRPCLR